MSDTPNNSHESVPFGKPIQFSLLGMLASTALIATCLAMSVSWGGFGVFCAFLLVVAAVTVWFSKRRARAVVIVCSVYVAVTCIGFLFLQVSGSARPIARRMNCASNMHQVQVAIVAYRDDHGEYPPAYTVDEHGNPLHSWRTLLLPYLEAGNVYKAIRLDEPWDSEYNSKFHSIPMKIFCCPSCSLHDEQGRRRTNTSYCAVVGPNTMWRGGEAVTPGEVTDDPAEIISLVEVADSGIHWMEPRDLHVVQMAKGINSEHGQGISSYHLEGANVVFLDGHSGYLADSIDPNQIDAMLTINGSDITR